MDGSSNDNDTINDDYFYDINCSERRCMTLSEFKAKWMIILQRQRITSQILLSVSVSHHNNNSHTETTTKNNMTNKNTNNSSNNNADDVINLEADGYNRISTKRRMIIERLRKRRRLGHTIRRNQLRPTDHEDRHGTSKDDIIDRHDPYDCYHQVNIPSSHDAIDRVVEETIQQWRALDERKISAAALSQCHNNSNQNDTTNIKTTLPKWYEKHVRLPIGFDYASLRNTPPDENDDDNNDDWVINFMDPTRPLLYTTELWKLFHSIPTRPQIEALICHPHQLPNTHRWFHNDGNDIGGTSSHGGAILQGTETCPSHDWDQYGLSRFRLNDRHDLPPIPLLSPKQPHSNTTTQLATNKTTTTVSEYCGLIRLECLRKQLRRTSTPDPNRMVVEFLGSQTLYDVHCAIVELTDDELWYDYAKNVPVSSIDINDSSKNENDDDHDEDDNADPTTRNRNIQQLGLEPVLPPVQITSPDLTNAVNDNISSGYFFIENTFYTTGSVDYITPILQWLQTGTIREQKRRMEHLGIGPTLPTIQSMTDMILDHLPTRLGVRYVHVHHGDVECAIFVTDRRLMLQDEIQQIHQFPIIHDIWTSSYSIPDCDYCQNRVSVIATSTECQVTNGHAVLCEACGQQLQLHRTSRNQIERYTIWRGQADLSAGASNEVAW